MRVTVTPGWTAEEIREFVFEYERQPYGSKADFLTRQGVSLGRLRRWRDTVFDGDLDRGLVPRQGGGMSSASQRRREARTHSGSTHSGSEDEVKQLRARVAELEAANDALGKAIGLLHKMNEHEPDNSPTTPDQPNS